MHHGQRLVRARVSEKAGGRLIRPHTVKTIPGYTFSVDAGTVDVYTRHVKQGDPKR